MIRTMKTFLVFFVAMVSLAQSGETKPPDAVVAAYFKADSAVQAARAQHDALMEQVKRDVADSVARQVNAMSQLVVAWSQLNAACGELQLDQQAIKQGEVKCMDKPKVK